MKQKVTLGALSNLEVSTDFYPNINYELEMYGPNHVVEIDKRDALSLGLIDEDETASIIRQKVFIVMSIYFNGFTKVLKVFDDEERAIDCADFYKKHNNYFGCQVAQFELNPDNDSETDYKIIYTSDEEYNQS